MDYSLPGFSVLEILYARNTGVGCHFFRQGIFLIQEAACAFRASCIGRQILDHWATQDAVGFSNLCQRLLVLWNLHSVIICSHFEYIKSVFEGMSCSRGDPCVSMSFQPYSAHELTDACHWAPSTSLKHNRRRSSTFFSMFAAQVWWHPTVAVLCGYQKEIRGF